jgi:hypothetical protein
MGFKDRVAKALNLPAGAVTQTEAQIAAQVPSSGTNAVPLERNPADYTVPFAPGRPLVPSLINVPREDGRAAPRRSEFPVAWNLQITEQRVVPFRLLRDIADMADLVRKCIEINKAAISGMDWDITLSGEATERIMSESGGTGHAAAAKAARQELLPEITRCKDFWQMPDRVNGLSFPEWVSMALEEMLVIDALTIYPNKTMDQENLHSLEILDGATIKPLLDDRGSRPLPPFPAYQQILWGFPRGEFTASADADGEFTADDLIYSPRTRRPFTPYGYSAVERALPMIDLYLKRVQWLRTEYTDGVTPDVFMATDATFGDNPELLRGYERIMNDDLAGKSEQRRRARMLPDGMTPIFPPSPDAKFNPDQDEYILKQLCGHFGVMPTQLGFAPKGGLGGVGVQEGEASSAQTLGMRPTVLWLTDLLNQLSYRFLNMPKDLTFTLRDSSSLDEQLDAVRRSSDLMSGQITMNEARAEVGRPLFDFPEADMPLIPNNLVPVADAQEIASRLPVTPVETANLEPIPTATPETEDDSGNTGMTDSDKTVNPVQIELAAFAKWTKGARKREFMFEFLDGDKAKSLNVLAKHDPSAARELAHVFKAGKAEDSFVPPKGAQTAAKRALEWMKEGHAGSGFTDTGRKRASDLARGAAVSPETIGRMVSFFARHESDKKATGFNSGEEGFPSGGRVAWDAWGGDAGKSWAESVYNRLNPDKDASGIGKASDGDSASVLVGEDAGRGTDFAVYDADPRFTWKRR